MIPKHNRNEREGTLSLMRNRAVCLGWSVAADLKIALQLHSLPRQQWRLATKTQSPVGNGTLAGFDL